MPNGKQGYSRKVVNRNGDVLFLPEFATMEDLKVGDIDIYGESSTPLFPVDSVIKRGRQEFAYTLNGAVALTMGTPLQSAAAVHAEQDDDIDVDVTVAQPIGSYAVYLTSTANLDNSPNNVANEFKNGLLIVNDATGERQMYKIKANEALSTTDVAKFTLYEPLTVALDTNSQIGIIRAVGQKVIATAAPLTGVFAGIPLIAVTAAYYFWAVIRGPAPCIADGAIAKNAPVIVGKTAAKVSAQYGDYATMTVIGYCITPGVTDTESCIVNLQ